MRSGHASLVTAAPPLLSNVALSVLDEQASRRGKSHPPALSEPCLNLSAYTAPIVQPPGLRPKRQWANSRGDRREASANPTWDVMRTRHRQGFNVVHPSGLPLTCDTRSEQAPLGFPLSSAPSRYRPRTSGRGQVWNTDRVTSSATRRTSNRRNLLITCDFVSHRTLMPRSARRTSDQMCTHADPQRGRWRFLGPPHRDHEARLNRTRSADMA